MPGTPTAKYGLDTMNGAVDAGSTIDGTHNAAMAKIDAAMVGYSAGTLAARPTSTPGSPGITGRRYRATDTGQEFIDTGTSWIEIATSPVATAQIGDAAVTTPKFADAAVTTPKIADAAVTSRKMAPTIVVAANPSASQVGGAEADIAGSVLNVTPLVVSTVVVQAVVRMGMNGGAHPFLWVRQDVVNDVLASEWFPTDAETITSPVFAVYTGVTAAAHTYRLRFSGSGATVTGFRIMATVYAQ